MFSSEGDDQPCQVIVSDVPLYYLSLFRILVVRVPCEHMHRFVWVYWGKRYHLVILGVGVFPLLVGGLGLCPSTYLLVGK